MFIFDCVMGRFECFDLVDFKILLFKKFSFKFNIVIIEMKIINNTFEPSLNATTFVIFRNEPQICRIQQNLELS